jgi:DAPG hydrolase PhiG domain
MTTDASPLLATPELDEAARLLDPAPLALETGVVRLPSGVLHVAARTDMPACKGRMLEWWFRFAPDTRQYAWWHPLDHVASQWMETSARTHIGSTHIVQERLGSGPPVPLQIHFIDPDEIFGAGVVNEARERGDISAVIAAQIGFGADFPRDQRGRPNSSRMTHIARDTEDGMVLRSRFWLGGGTGLPREVLLEAVPDFIGLGLMQHSHTEFKYLSRFLPSLYLAENRDHEHIPLPW